MVCLMSGKQNYGFPNFELNHVSHNLYLFIFFSEIKLDIAIVITLNNQEKISPSF